MGHSRIKLRISDDALADMAQHHDWTTWRETIEAAGIDAPELEQLRAENAQLKAQNDPELDATDAAHPAWWRGQEQASREWSKRLETMRAENERLKSESLLRGFQLAELDRLRALLASGQCVDLSQLTDWDIGLATAIKEDETKSDTASSEDGAEVRQWLIAKAGVKL